MLLLQVKVKKIMSEQSKTRLIGPNCPGIIKPGGQARVGGWLFTLRPSGGRRDCSSRSKRHLLALPACMLPTSPPPHPPACLLTYLQGSARSASCPATSTPPEKSASCPALVGVRGERGAAGVVVLGLAGGGRCSLRDGELGRELSHVPLCRHMLQAP